MLSSMWSRSDRTTMASQELLISSSTDSRRYSKKGTDKSHIGPKIPYKKACDRPAVSVARRNARERKRVHTVNQMFSILKTRLPALQQKTKRVSKLKILKAAMEYIYDMQDILDACPPPTRPSQSSVVSDCSFYSNQPMEKLPTYSTITSGGTMRINGHYGQSHSVGVSTDADCTTIQRQLRYCSQPKWANLALPAISADQQSQQNSNYGRSSQSSVFNNETGRDSACQMPFFGDANGYDSKYYYYGNQGQGYPY